MVKNNNKCNKYSSYVRLLLLYSGVVLDGSGLPYSGLGLITFRNATQVMYTGYLCDDEAWNIKTGEVLCKHAGYFGVHKVLHNAESK